jgi:hypothetical protein
MVRGGAPLSGVVGIYEWVESSLMPLGLIWGSTTLTAAIIV